MAPRTGTFQHGLAVGFIAWAVVVVFYAGYDLLASRGPLYTVNALGLALTGGAEAAIDGIAVPLDPTAVALYSIVHLAAAFLIGFIVVALVANAEADRRRSATVLFVLVGGFVATVALVGFLSIPIRTVLPWWSILAANAMAVALATWYILGAYPEVFRHLTDPGAEGSERTKGERARP
jgi:hypothetical protein